MKQKISASWEDSYSFQRPAGMLAVLNKLVAESRHAPD